MWFDANFYMYYLIIRINQFSRLLGFQIFKLRIAIFCNVEPTLRREPQESGGPTNKTKPNNFTVLEFKALKGSQQQNPLKIEELDIILLISFI